MFAVLAAVVAVTSWYFLIREPSHNGKTVTEWLDGLVLQTSRIEDNGDVTIHNRPTKEIAADPAFTALSAIGPRAVPVLLKHIKARANYPSDLDLKERLEMRWRWTWYRWRGPGKASRPTSGGWPKSQSDRKSAAAFALVVLGTNGHGGLPPLIEAYATAPRFESVYGGKMAGAPLGFTPSTAVELACAVRPQLRAELLAGVRENLLHTNGFYRTMATDCASVFPETYRVFIESRQTAK